MHATALPTLLEWWRNQTGNAEKIQKKGLCSAFLTVHWEIWMERNNRIFLSTESTPPAIAGKIVDELQLWGMAGAKGVQNVISRE
uniref:Uncharacterized protein n=1 Tax=Oryza barthii TaxID=65489 RepID=A0A0D3GN96_9ORYZ